jgi:hypothetical protein
MGQDCLGTFILLEAAYPSLQPLFKAFTSSVSIKYQLSSKLPVSVTAMNVIAAIRYAFPALTLFYFVIALAVSACTLQTVSPKVKDQRNLILCLMLGVLCEYASFHRPSLICDKKVSVVCANVRLQMIQALLSLVRPFFQTNWNGSQDEVVSYWPGFFQLLLTFYEGLSLIFKFSMGNPISCSHGFDVSCLASILR